MTTGEVIALIKAFGGGGGGSSGGGGLVVNVTVDPGTGSALCDKTAGEIMAVADAGGSVVFKKVFDENEFVIDYMTSAEYYNPAYEFVVGFDSRYAAESASDYPTRGGSD